MPSGSRPVAAIVGRHSRLHDAIDTSDVTLQRPPELIENNAQARGPEGLAWLNRLPELIARFAARWKLTVEAPFGDLSFNYAAPAVRADGTRAVFKLSPPCDAESFGEIAAVRAFGGRGMARLLEVDTDECAMLLERLEPGLPLHTLRNERLEMTIAAGIMRRLWRPVPAGFSFVTVERWGEAFGRHRAEYAGGSGPLPAMLFDEGERLYHELAATTSRRVLLHGDLHQGNILSAARSPWLAIDPKGVVGDPAFEIGSILLNLWDDLYPVADAEAVLYWLVRWLADDLHLERERVRLWGIARLVLSAVWSATGNGTGWAQAIRLAELLRAQRS